MENDRNHESIERSHEPEARSQKPEARSENRVKESLPAIQQTEDVKNARPIYLILAPGSWLLASTPRNAGYRLLSSVDYREFRAKDSRLHYAQTHRYPHDPHHRLRSHRHRPMLRASLL